MDRIIIGILISVMLAFGGFVYVKKGEYDKIITTLRDSVLNHENTIQIKEGIWMKNAKEIVDLKVLLDESKKEQQVLKEVLKKNKSEVFALTELNVKIKKDYEAVLKDVKQTEIFDENKKSRSKVEFDKEFGIYKISGYTLTNPGEASLKLSQTRPLRLTVAVSKQNDKWAATTAVSEEDLGLDISISAIDTTIFHEKWYEKIGLLTQLGGGTVNGNAAALLGVGLTYEIGKFTFGPSVLFSTTGKSDRFYTANVIWNPFKN